MNNPYQAPSADLHSASNQAPLQYAGFWLRTAAYLIDAILMSLITYPLLFLVVGSGFMDPYQSEQVMMSPLYWLISFGLPIAYVLGFWFTKRATPGKMLFSSQIVDAKTGGQPSKGQYIGRYFGYILSSIPLGLGFLWAAWDQRKQTWHDKLSGTVVVKPTSDPERQISFEQQ